jgi:exonuclease III
MDNNNKSLSCLQVNLQHCKVASLNLSQVILELDIDIILIQEPYAITNKFNNELFIPNVPENYTVHHNLSKEHAFGAMILAKKNLKAHNVAVPSTNNCIGVELINYPSIKFFSVYCRPSLGLKYSLNLIKINFN